MTKLIKLSTLMLLLMAPLSVFAEGKIAVLNMQQAILNTEQAQARLKQWRSEAGVAENIKELENLGKSHKKLVEKLQKDAAVMSDAQKQAEAKKIQEKRADIEHVQRKLQAAEQQVLQTLMQEMGPKLKKVVDDLIKSEGIGLLINQQAAMYVDSSFSVTAKVTDKLNKEK